MPRTTMDTPTVIMISVMLEADRAGRTVSRSISMPMMVTLATEATNARTSGKPQRM